MSAPHPGKWSPVFETPGNPEIQPFIVLDTEQVAAHAAVICTNLSAQSWKILYGYPINREDIQPPGDNKVKTRIWDPKSNEISKQSIPDWPLPGADKPALFCGGHTYLSDGRILWAGGMRLGEQETDAPHYPDANITGNNYTYIFDPNPQIPGQYWNIAQYREEPHSMSDDRYYPTLIHLGVIPPGSISGKIVAMSGWTTQPNLNREPEFYDEINGWSQFPYSGATQPFDGEFEYYPSAHLVPAGPNAGKIFYDLPMHQSYIFNPFFNGFPNGGYWQQIGSPRTQYRLNGTSTMLPLLPPYNSAKVIIIGGSTSYHGQGHLAVKSAEVIDIASSNPQ